MPQRGEQSYFCRAKSAITSTDSGVAFMFKQFGAPYLTQYKAYRAASLANGGTEDTCYQSMILTIGFAVQVAFCQRSDPAPCAAVANTARVLGIRPPAFMEQNE
jgi:hypothetical protein